MNIPENLLSVLTEEQKKKLEAAKTQEEFASLLKEMDLPLSDDLLEGVAGGESYVCAKVGSCITKTLKPGPTIL